MSTLSQAVQEAIQKDLPGFVAGELKTFIAQAEQTARDLASVKALLDAERSITANQKKELNQHAELSQREREIAAALAAVQQRELDLLKREAGMDAAVAKAELAGVKDTANMFLRNVTVRQTIV